jgi:hypothetical protein
MDSNAVEPLRHRVGTAPYGRVGTAHRNDTAVDRERSSIMRCRRGRSPPRMRRFTRRLVETVMLPMRGIPPCHAT